MLLLTNCDRIIKLHHSSLVFDPPVGQKNCNTDTGMTKIQHIAVYDCI